MPDPKDRPVPSAPNALTLVAPSAEDLSSGVRNVDAYTVPTTGALAPPPAAGPRSDPYLGRTLDGRYIVEQMLGEGGMGVVYRGRHHVIDKRVAIKILRGDLAADAEMTDRFLNEARAASSIGNPHIVDISDFGRLPDGATYFVMEFLDGISLGELMANSGVIPVPRLVHIAKQIARGLAAAHARGIVHRDLKPDNVMLVQRGDDRDFAKVLDFGIAKVSSEAGRLTRAGSVFGTPHYMSPEQAAGVPVDQRTDIYSLGVILYEMAVGRVPFDADNFMGILTQHMYKSPAPIRAVVPQPQEVPPGLEAIVLKCLSKKVELRYQTMDELAADLERVERGMVPEAVQEMMGRSGGFNVPADYFRKQHQLPGGAAMMPGTPALPTRRSPLHYVLLSLGAVSLVIVLVVIATSLRAAPKVDPAPPLTASIAAPPPATTESATAMAAPALRPVQIVTVPSDAQVFQENKSLGVAPVTVGVPPDGTTVIRIERQGFIAKTLTVDAAHDGAKGRVDVTLDRDYGKFAPPVKPPPKSTGKGATSGPPPPVAPPPPAPPSNGKKPIECPAGMRLDPWGKACEKAL